VDTDVTEIADRIYRLSTFRDPPGMAFNQFLLAAEEPLIFHTGHRALFGQITEAVGRILDPASVRWISFGHLEADECGSMNEWLAAAPAATVVQGQLGVSVSLADMADRPPRMLADGAALDLGGMRVRWIDTSQLPHGWEAGLLFEETTATLLAGDLFTALGHVPAMSQGDIVAPALDTEDRFHATALTARTARKIRELAQLAPATLATMHASSFSGDGATALHDLADGYQARFTESARELSGH
jgi:flavorubredoxin